MSRFPLASEYTWTQKPIRIGGGFEKHTIDNRPYVTAELIRPELWGYLDHIVIQWENQPGRPNMDARVPFELYIASNDALLVFPIVRDVLPSVDAFGVAEPVIIRP